MPGPIQQLVGPWPQSLSRLVRKKIHEDDERTVRRTFHDIGRQLRIAQRLVEWVREQLNRAMQSQLICQRSQELSRSVHARQKDNRSSFGRAHPGIIARRGSIKPSQPALSRMG